LRELLKDGVKFVWSEKCQAAFETLKEALISKPVLALSDFNKPEHRRVCLFN
jgi:RNase H-like domain found in reverse transcriptase